MRLQWWKEQVAAIHSGKRVPEHPVAVALSAALKNSGMGIHSFTFKLNLRGSDTSKHPTHPKHPLTPPENGLHNPYAHPLSHKIRLS